MHPALEPTAFIDSDHPAVQDFAARAAGAAVTPRARAVALYYAVRDEIRYNPYKIDLSPAGLKASRVLADGFGWCVPKAVLLAAACRAQGIPARLGFADVHNHLSTERLRQAMGSDVFRYHGYTLIEIEGQWLKATPAFNIELCEKMGLLPLEFDGTADSIYHEFDAAGRKHMEYVRFRGEMDDLPHQDLLRIFKKYYATLDRLDNESWDNDVAAEGKTDGK